MKPHFLPGTLFVLYCVFGGAVAWGVTGQVWRVSNIGGHPRDFMTVSEALTSPQVQDGDTLILQGDFTGSDTTLTRRLHLVGYGYYHAENGYTFSPGTPLEGRLASLTIEAGATNRADGASVTGCVIGSVRINDASGITLRRNKLKNIILAGTGTNAARGITIAQNYMLGWTPNYDMTVNSTHSATNYDILIVGNYMSQSGNTWNPGRSLTTGPEDTVAVLNNVMNGPTDIGGYGSFQNNIVLDSCSFSSWCTVDHNMAVAGSYLPSGGGNINGQSVGAVFSGGSSPDGWWRLKADSPAIGVGAGGDDMGMYDGPLPYVLSGLPPLPMITSLQIPPVVQDGEDLTVTVRAATNP